MTSESSHARINQYFSSRKRKHPPSPAPEPAQKGAKHERCRQSAGEGSPGAKGTLESFLEKSPGVGSRSTAGGVAPSGCVSSAKGKLTLEDVSISDVNREPVLVSNSGDGISRKVENADPMGEQGDARRATVLEMPSPGTDATGNSELKRFATDFLALYCSDLQSAVNHPLERELKGQERSSSPSTLVACNNMQCLSDQTDHPGEVGESHGDFKLETSNHGVKDFSLRRCGSTPISGMKKTSPCMPGPPGLLPTTEKNRETPKSVSRNSIFSPGDDFWIEAIQVADGFHPELEKFAENTAFAKGGRSGDKLLKDELSCAGPHHAKTSNKSCNYDSTWDMPLKSSLLPLGKAVQESNVILGVTEHDGMSPLPVKHLDFFHDDNIHLGATVKDKVGSSPLDGYRDVSSVEHKYSKLQRSQMCSEGIACDASIGESLMKQTMNINYAEASISPISMPSKSCGQLDSWLPSEVCSVYMKKGVAQLYPWQVECLLVDGVLDKRNLVYCASTSAGKSFVAEILMLRRVLLTGKMAVLVLPYVSICAEKAEHLELLLEPLGKHVRSFYGNQGGGSLPKDTSVAVCTIEKANSLINRLLEEGRLSELGIIVIDELHMVADRHRGYLLELMLTKLRYASGDGNSDSSSEESPGMSSGKTDPAHGLQIVGMSATMPNVAAVADWLQAALYQTDFRPVPLEEYIKVGNTIFDKKMNIVRVLPKAADLGGKDPDNVVELCNEIVQEGHSVLIFCSSRKGCESTARHVSRFLKSFSVGTCEKECEYGDVSAAIEALKRCPAGLDPILEETIPNGVAYHHAGLTVEEREIIETCYRKGLIRVLTATSTLAAGVNLPARRVIFRQPRIGRDFIDGTRYRQMAGRAGRTGIDTKGDSILLCRPDESKRITALLNDSCPPLQSCLSEDENGMIHAIMEVVAGGIVQTANDINRYVRCTLLNSTKPFEEVVRSAQDSLRWLCKRKFLEWNDETKLYSTTPLGRAAFGSSLTPEESLVVLDDLTRAREGFVLASDLHLVFLVAPINVEVEPDWELYYERFMELSSIEQSVGNRVGVAEPFLMRMAHGAPMPVQDRLRGKNNKLPDKQTGSLAIDSSVLFNEQIIRVSRRFYVALMLSRLVQEVPVADVCNAFKVARGMIQALQENAGRFASMVSVFCERLGWHDLGGLISKFQNRVSFGVRAEIAELTTIPYVKGSRARALYKAGLRTPLSIAEASTTEIAKALFENSSWIGQNEGDIAQRRMQLGLSKKIKNAARKIVLDQAEEARMAAFSTFKSLGLNVPQFSRPLLADMAVETPVGGDSACLQVVVRGGINTTETESIHVASRRGENSSFKYASPVIKEGSPTVTNALTLNISRKVDTKSDVQCHSDYNNSGIVAKTSIACSSGKLDVGVMKSSRPSFSDPQAGCMVDVKTDNVDGNNNGERKTNSSDSLISDKGPINVSKFPGGIDCFLNEMDATNEFCFDLHFVTRSSHQSSDIHEVFGLAVCWKSSPVYYCNFPKDLLGCVNHSAFDTWEVAKGRWNRLGNIMGKRGVRKVTWNLKIQIQAFKFPCTSVQRLGDVSIDNKMLIADSSFLLLPSISVHDGIDVSLVTWILWPDEESKSTPNLEKAVKKRLSSEAAAAASRDGRWRSQMRKAAHNGCCLRVAKVRALSSALWKLLLSEELFEALIKIENPLVEVLAEMEFWGIGVDMEACLNARHILIRKVKELEKEAYKLAGMPFSLYTSADIANVLYTHLKLPIPQGCEKGKLHPSTNKHSLDILRDQHPIISVIKEHRTLAKLLNSTLGSICSRARMCVNSQKYIIQGHWLQTSTATGRLSMEEPNLQCVEHTLAFTTSKTNENNSSLSELDSHQINARDFFIPTQENWIFLTADYSQIELRLMAHFSKDHSLIELLSKPNGDVFLMISSRWKSKPESAVSSEERDFTKRLIYGILYGMGANSLSEQLGCSPTEAAEKIQSFKSSFPGVASWLNEAVEFCQDKGFVKTLMGRKRFLPKIKFGNSNEKSKAQRQAVNSICQGSAADIIKVAMLTIHSVITEGNGACKREVELADKFSSLRGHCHIILQVHDELVLEVDPDYASEAANLLQMSMETAASLLVPLHVKLKVGRTWGSLEPFQPKS